MNSEKLIIGEIYRVEFDNPASSYNFIGAYKGTKKAADGETNHVFRSITGIENLVDVLHINDEEYTVIQMPKTVIDYGIELAEEFGKNNAIAMLQKQVDALEKDIRSSGGIGTFALICEMSGKQTAIKYIKDKF